MTVHPNQAHATCGSDWSHYLWNRPHLAYFLNCCAVDFIDHIGSKSVTIDPDRMALHNIVLETTLEELEGTGRRGLRGRSPNAVLLSTIVDCADVVYSISYDRLDMSGLRISKP